MNKKTYLIVGGIALGLIGIGSGVFYYLSNNSNPVTNDAVQTDVVEEKTEATLLTEVPESEKLPQYSSTVRTYNINDMQGTPNKSMFKDLTNPIFKTVAEDTEAKDNDIVGVFNLDREYRAYPLKYMTYHHIANDTFGNTPVLISYCGICNSIAAFDPIVNGQKLSFGVLGTLLHDDMVMYDRGTDSYWAQITGDAFYGTLKGTKLELLPGMEMVKYSEYKAAHPEGKVLQGDPASTSRYFSMGGEMREPGNSYDQVIGIVVQDIAKMYKLTDIEAKGIANDSVNGWSILALADPIDGGVRLFRRYVPDVGVLEFTLSNGVITDNQTSSTWDFNGLSTAAELKGTQLTKPYYLELYEFAWKGFYPETLLYK